MKYFAYGSNLLTSRLKARCPSAVAEYTARLSKYKLVFDKPSHDNTSKANIVYTGSNKDYVYGVVFNISKQDVYNLDYAEGEGSHYLRTTCKVMNTSINKRSVVHIYLSMFLPAKYMYPACWYMKYIVAGAVEHKLPNSYIAELINTKCVAKMEAAYFNSC